MHESYIDVNMFMRLTSSKEGPNIMDKIGELSSFALPNAATGLVRTLTGDTVVTSVSTLIAPKFSREGKLLQADVNLTAKTKV